MAMMMIRRKGKGMRIREGIFGNEKIHASFPYRPWTSLSTIGIRNLLCRFHGVHTQLITHAQPLQDRLALHHHTSSIPSF